MIAWLALTLLAAEPRPPESLRCSTPEEKPACLESLARALGTQLLQYRLSPAELRAVVAALPAARTSADATGCLDALVTRYRLEQAKINGAKFAHWRAKNWSCPDGGTQDWCELAPGDGGVAQGRLTLRGTWAVAGADAGADFELRDVGLNELLPCLATLPLREGSRGRVWCDAASAYGEDGAPGVPSGAALIVSLSVLELLEGDAGVVQRVASRSGAVDAGCFAEIGGVVGDIAREYGLNEEERRLVSRLMADGGFPEELADRDLLRIDALKAGGGGNTVTPCAAGCAKLDPPELGFRCAPQKARTSWKRVRASFVVQPSDGKVHQVDSYPYTELLPCWRRGLMGTESKGQVVKLQCDPEFAYGRGVASPGFKVPPGQCLTFYITIDGFD